MKFFLKYLAYYEKQIPTKYLVKRLGGEKVGEKSKGRKKREQGILTGTSENGKKVVISKIGIW